MGLFLLASIFQISVGNLFSIYGVKPDLVLLLVIFNALLQGHREGAFMGFFAGLIEDLLIFGWPGLNVLVKMAAGYLAGLGKNSLYQDNLLVVIIISWTVTLAAQMLYYLLLLYMQIQVTPALAMFQVMLPVATYNAILVPLLYPRFYKSSLYGWLRKMET